MKKSTFSRCVQRYSILLAAMYAISCSAQSATGPNYLSILNDVGIMSCSACCSSYNNTFNCTAAPSGSSFTAIQPITPYIFPSTGGSYYQNAVYDNAGTVLFYVDYGGIYDPTGSGLFAFSTPITYTLSGCTLEPSYTYNPTNALSEIVTFPVPGKCNAYYVVFWCGLVV